MLIPNYIDYVMMHLQEHGHKTFLVGGAARDIFMPSSRPIHDFDITTSATPGEVSQLFRKVIPTGIEHGTVTVVVDGHQVEITTLRKEGKYSDFRHPDNVIFTDDILEDLSRRDFTVNAIAIDNQRNVFDPFSGLKDLQRGLIKAVGNPSDRFTEDPLRMIRAIRFMCTLSSTDIIMSIDTPTYLSIAKNYNLIQKVSMERVRDELCKIILSEESFCGIELLHDTGLLEHIIPELEDCYGFEQYNPHHDSDVFYHTLEVLENTPPRLNLRLAALFHDIGKPHTFTRDKNGVGHFYRHQVVGEMMCYKKILPRLKFSKDTIRSVSTLVREHMSLQPQMDGRSLKKLIARVGEEHLDDLFELHKADILGCKPDPEEKLKQLVGTRVRVDKILADKDALTIRDLAINGHDLLKIGMEPGKAMGEALKKLLELVLSDSSCNTKENLLREAKTLGEKGVK